MTTHSDPSPPASENSRKRIKPHQLVVGIGCFIGLFTLVSGILPQITEWHDDKHPSREVFGGIPGALQVAFYTVIPSAASDCAAAFIASHSSTVMFTSRAWLPL